ncbi:MAG: TonB-dependent receptor [Pseudomonadota bacterium]
MSVFLVSLPLSLSASAQAADETDTPMENEPGVIEEVVVIGTKQETTLQDTDVSVTVLTEQLLLDARVTDIARIDDLVPSVQFNDGNAVGGVFISIRGVESNPFIVNRAAVYIDGIPFRELSNSVLTQLKSVEVLRGPQSTLYGANTVSGLIVINTRAPTEELIANATVTASSFDTGESYEGEVFLGGPLIDNVLAGSVSFKYSDRDYYLQNIGATPQGQGEIEDVYVQGRLSWTPTDRWTVDALAYVIDTDGPGIYSFDGFPVDLDRYNAIYSDGILFDPSDPFSIPPFNGELRATDFQFVHDAPKRVTVEQQVAGVNANYDLRPGSLDFALSYRSEDEDDRGFDIDLTNAPLLAGAELASEEVFNTELRFTSDRSRPLRAIVGASYYQEDEEQRLGSLLGVGGLEDFNFAPEQARSSRDFGVFGSLIYTPPSLPKLTATVGLRYDRAERETTQQEGELDLGFAVFLFDDLQLEDTFDAFLPRFALRYEPSDRLTWYASAAQGYLPGGFNLTAAQDGFQDDVIRYDSEELWSYEAGFKWQSQDGRAFLAGAVYYIEADNYQEIAALLDEEGNVVSTSFIGSDAGIENYGFEVEGRWALDERWSLSGNFGWVDAEYTEFGRGQAENVVGNPVKLIPDYDANLALRYAHPSGFFIRGEINFIGEMALDEGDRSGFTANAIDTQEAVELYGVQVGYEAERWSIRAFGENLTDVRRVGGTGFPNAVLPNDGLLYAAIDPPRIVGVELAFRY